MKSFSAVVSSLAIACVAGEALLSSSDSNAEEARWLLSTSRWGTFSTYDSGDDLRAEILSHATDDHGRIFFYLMGEHTASGAFTLSEASLIPEQFPEGKCGESSDADVEDPRCAKITLSGKVSPCSSEEDRSTGRDALYRQHPQMANWPTGHHFTVHEFVIGEIWMIANYGGGNVVSPEKYYKAKPVHHSSQSFWPNEEKNEKIKQPYDTDAMPAWSEKVARARWIVGHSLWTTVSTHSVRLNGKAWGNIRSTVDGSTLSDSKGTPVFYLPGPDPTSIDVQADARVALTFTEASLAERVVMDKNEGMLCGKRDVQSPLCGRVVLSGKATPIKDTKELEAIKKDFSARHPLAKWLANGGAHTGGDYYTIEVDGVLLFDYFGGPSHVSVTDYLAWKEPTEDVKVEY